MPPFRVGPQRQNPNRFKWQDTKTAVAGISQTQFMGCVTKEIMLIGKKQESRRGIK